MPNLPYKDTEGYTPAALLEAIKTRRGPSGLLNLDRMLIHSPPLAEGWNYFLGKLRSDLALDGKLRELAICAVGILTGAEYEVYQHAPIWRALGGTAAQEAALRDIDTAVAHVVFDATERAVVQLAIEMSRNTKVQSATMAAVRAALPDDQHVVELIAIISAYNMVARFLVATGAEIEGQENVAP